MRAIQALAEDVPRADLLKQFKLQGVPVETANTALDTAERTLKYYRRKDITRRMMLRVGLLLAAAVVAGVICLVFETFRIAGLIAAIALFLLAMIIFLRGMLKLR